MDGIARVRGEQDEAVYLRPIASIFFSPSITDIKKETACWDTETHRVGDFSALVPPGSIFTPPRISILPFEKVFPEAGSLSITFVLQVMV